MKARVYLASTPAPLLFPPPALELVKDSSLLELEHGGVDQRTVGGAWHAFGTGFRMWTNSPMNTEA